MLLGTGAFVIGLAEPAGPAGRGFLVTTIGVSAIVAGVRAVRRERNGSTAVRIFGRTGAIFGGVGSALMAYALVASLLAPSGVHLPSLSVRNTIQEIKSEQVSAPMAASTTAARSATVATPAPQPGGTTTAVPATSASETGNSPTVPWVPSTAASESAAVTEVAQALASSMESEFPSGGPYPSTLELAGTTYELVALPAGTPLTRVPNGARVSYATSSDDSSWSVTIVGASFGQQASYSSGSNVVTRG
ncbi:hypothetical protein [Curtobacterium sp. MCBD17_019]|uniref:hypothetical protein n=1 Tax=Curtobacterium sp. MCBD17_019 TaxID=2175669 RepID=UPI000DA99F57|nr:hypothetical protein [Curtobacterium sp. MCBD17_019]PZE76584.1 hypothetical protein DEI82_05320 [Curtobacterium sp. MCBD17_019]